MSLETRLNILRDAAVDRSPVSGWSHNFYRYPARFSPTFASAAIQCFSKTGDLVCDPYMGGGTTVVEALVAGRDAIGNDLNSLAAFVTRVKITPLTRIERTTLHAWAVDEVKNLSYRTPAVHLAEFIDQTKIRNLSLTRGRFIKKVVAAALASISTLPTENSQNFARCAILRAGQWALDGRSRHTPLGDFRLRLGEMLPEMLDANSQLSDRIRSVGSEATLLNVDSASLHSSPLFAKRPVDLVVTSPPYPGVHVLYHRWQVDGRRETPAPYWIAGCNDGEGASFYNFGDKRQSAADNYFQASLATLRSIRTVMRDGAYIIQMLAFNRPDEQFPRYLANMEQAGFEETSMDNRRIWREVPQRKWHATYRGKTASSNEVVLIHRAI